MNNKRKYILITIVTIFCILSCTYIGYCCFSKGDENNENDKCDMDSNVEETRTENSLDLTENEEEKENKLPTFIIKNSILKEDSIIEHQDDEVEQQKRNDEVKKPNDDCNSIDDKRIILDEKINKVNTLHREFLDFLKQDNKINSEEEKNDKEKTFKERVEYFEDKNKNSAKKTREKNKIVINNNEKSKSISDINEKVIIDNKLKTDSSNKISTEQTQSMSEYKPTFYERAFDYFPMTKFNKDNQIKTNEEIKHKNGTDNDNKQSIIVKPHFTRRVLGLVFDYITSLYNFIHPKVSIVQDNSKENHEQSERDTSTDREYLKVTGGYLTLKDKEDKKKFLKSFGDEGSTFLITLKNEDISDKADSQRRNKMAI
ncbi:hypothetical protein SLOPH_827 [Spraguea lophii 42_110]|uniref:Uncharacterized protein n=1 Tax=Spraguea lophii (strain 42_110) TaxID=1358809 RepID=S7WC13_SPRLO|nr:hypothetical protein SLOPH_827 [Spraguea lophii 42_110]